MRYRISTEKANNPFTQPLFKGFALPQTLLQDGVQGQPAGKRTVTTSGAPMALTQHVSLPGGLP